MDNYDFFKEELRNLEKAGNLRQLKTNSPDLIDLSSNDYLNLNNDSNLYESFLEKCGANRYKLSAASSRLLSGNSDEYVTLESQLPALYQSEASLVFNSGYHANIGILTALAGKNDLIIADKLVHASLIDGFRLSNADSFRYRHLDYKQLNDYLAKKRKDYNKVFIVSESIFSMDGDIANLTELIAIKKRHNCFLYLDEAHAVGARGESGLGIAEQQGCIKDIDLLVGTFGKALASVGAFLVCKEVVKKYLVNTSRSLIYTTALPPINLAWNIFILDQLKEFDFRRKELDLLSSYFASGLNVPHQSHIVPYIVGTNHNTIELSASLRQLGFKVLPIRTPTVPSGTARLRFSLKYGLPMNKLEAIFVQLKKF